MHTQPPTCIHHLVSPKLRCLWGKVSCEGESMCMLGVCVYREGGGDTKKLVIILSKREMYTAIYEKPYCKQLKKLHIPQILAALPGCKHKTFRETGEQHIYNTDM